jgi:pimeloyl-ACP methyl ester carboxylesterase
MTGAVAAGLCGTCVHARSVHSARGGSFVRCDLSQRDARFNKYPRLPMHACAGHIERSPGATAMTPRMIDTNGIQLEAFEQGEGPVVLLLHGFPESAYSWRHQLPALAQAGYRAIAPNQRGYAGSDQPGAIEDYDVPTLVRDAVGVLDAIGAEDAVVVGHDWGAPIAWHMALLHPERVRAVVGMSVPHGGRPSSPPLPRMQAIFKDVFFYILYFQEPGVAEAELEQDVRRSLRMFYDSASGDAAPRGAFAAHPKSARLLDTMRDCETLPEWLSEADLDHYSAQFEHSGFRGPINWYRNFDRNWQLTSAIAGKQIEQPALFIAGERDPVLTFSAGQLERMPSQCADLRGSLLLPGAGHWVQQERPEQVNAALLEFLKRLG